MEDETALIVYFHYLTIILETAELKIIQRKTYFPLPSVAMMKIRIVKSLNNNLYILSATLYNTNLLLPQNVATVCQSN